jgi:sulfide dehydrogenase cytochrome subunit
MRVSIVIFGLAAVVITVVLFASTGQAGDMKRGEMLSASCAGCHGTDGHSPGSIPDISGKSAEFIRISLMEFKSGQRPSTVMGRQAKGYTDEEIQLIAAYFGNQK